MKSIKKRWQMERRIVELLKSGHGTNHVSRVLSVCKKRVIRIREQAREHGYLEADAKLPAYPESLFPEVIDGRSHKQSEPEQILSERHDWIKERLETGWHSVTVFEELHDERISRSSFYRYLARHELDEKGKSFKRVIPSIKAKAGEVLEVDWGKLSDAVVNGKKATVWAFIGVAGFSRYRMVRLMFKCTIESTLSALASMYEELGGVPTRTVTDNPKVFALLANEYEPTLNPITERFAAHYGTILECLPPRRPELKGKVERQVRYIRRLNEAHDQWKGLEENQKYLNDKLALANQAQHGTTCRKPRDVLEAQERPLLKPLPVLPYEREEYHNGKIRRDGHIRFRGRYYSVDERYIEEEVVVIANSKVVSVFHAGKLIETHARITDPNITHSTKNCHLKPWERSLEDHSYYRTKARQIGISVEEMIVRVLSKNSGYIDYRKVWGILSLSKKYSNAEINKACERALEMGRIGYLAVRGLLKEPAVEVPEVVTAPVHKPAKFVRSMQEYKRKVELIIINGGDRNESRDSAQAIQNAKNANGRSGA